MPAPFVSQQIDLESATRFLRSTWIAGVEVTQAIQYQRAAEHLDDPADRGRDNSLALVADKAAWVRVYVRGTFVDQPGITGTATVERMHALGVWGEVGTLSPLGSGVVVAEHDPDYDDERRWTSSSLNFYVPAAVMRSAFRIRVDVRDASGRTVDTETTYVDASLHQTVKLRGFAVQYDGPDAAGTTTLHLAAPTLADFRSTLARTLLMWPVGQTPEISILGPTLWNTPLTGAITTSDGTSQCPTSWNNLLGWLAFGKWLDGNRSDVLYYGLLPSGIPLGGAGGCGGSAVAAGFVGAGLDMAHELGHSCGLDHAPCGLVAGDNGDPGYPAYEPYDTPTARMARIGEYGLDVNTGGVARPQTSADFMSYCKAGAWISPYHHRRLTENARLHPQHVVDKVKVPWEVELGTYDVDDLPDPPPPWFELPLERRGLLALTGRVVDGVVDVSAMARLEMTVPHEAPAVNGLRLELLDANGGVLATAPVREVAQAACGSGVTGRGGCGGAAGCGPCGRASTLGRPDGNGTFEVYVDDRDDVDTVRLVRGRGDEEVWTRRAPGEPPRIGAFDVAVEDDALRLRWEVEAAVEEPQVAMRWSADDGATWTVGAMQLSGREASVPLETFTDRAPLVQLVVGDGFHTVEGDPVRVKVPRRDPVPTILFPPDRVRLEAFGSGDTLRLWGTATADDGSAIDGDRLTWLVDGEEVGHGADLLPERRLAPGEHRVTLVAADGRRRAEATSRVTVVGPE